MRLSSLLAAIVLPIGLQAATIPYTNNFSGTGGNGAFASADSAWAVTGGVYRDTFSGGTNVTTTASNTLTNAPGTNFSISTQFTVTTISSYTASTNSLFTVGFGALSSTSNFASSGTYYLADFVFLAEPGNTYSLGDVRILSQGNQDDFTTNKGTAIASGATGNRAVVVGTTYTLKLTGVYTSGTLDLALGVYDASGTTLIGTQATASDTTPFMGTNFGYRNRTGGATTSGTIIDMDNYTATVPEPAMGLPIAAALGGLIVYLRRRKSQQA